MPPIKLRVSTIERFRALCEEDYVLPQELIDAVMRGQQGGPTSWKMDAGSAWHKVIERPNESAVGSGLNHRYESGGYSWHCDDVIGMFGAIGSGEQEIRKWKRYSVGGLTFDVTGQADHVYDRTISDIKTKFTTVNVADYEDSLQWRFYLDIHQCDAFRYLLCRMSQPKDGCVNLQNITTVRYFAYPQMVADLEGWLLRFAEWAEVNGLLPYLTKMGPI